MPICSDNAVHSLVDKIVLTPRDGKLQVDLAGDLAAILAMATNKKPAENEPDGMVQVKMVAGVGFEPTTFRL